MPLDEPHPIWPEGPDCDEQCPGKWSQYHDGFAWGVEKERARIRAAVERSLGHDIRELAQDAEKALHCAWPTMMLRVLAIIDRDDPDA